MCSPPHRSNRFPESNLDAGKNERLTFNLNSTGSGGSEGGGSGGGTTGGGSGGGALPATFLDTVQSGSVWITVLPGSPVTYAHTVTNTGPSLGNVGPINTILI